MRRLVAGALVLILAAVAWWGWLPQWRPSLGSGESYGVDVSAHQGAIDWPAVRRDHIAFTYVKATEGGDFTDGRFATNRADAAAAGIGVGGYHFFTLCSSGQAQAQHFLSVLRDPAAGLPPAVDLELAGNCSRRPPQADVQRELTAFVDAVEAASGRPLLIYAGSDFSHRYPLDVLSTHALWLRRWVRRPSGSAWRVWQAQARAHVHGISGDVDLDVMRPSTSP